MIEKFKINLNTNFPFLKNKKLFLAISGGIDSMVLLHLFQQLHYQFAILHCNFQLRNAESDADLEFVQAYADKFDIPWSFGHFQTKGYAKSKKISIQMAARELRYEWFEEQLIEKQFDFVLTAHHADDVLETFIINLSRGSGLDGLTGIPEINDKIIRPMLPFSRQEIENYAKINNLKWREDSSNNSEKYLRNNIRHNIAPLLKELNPNFLSSFQATINYLKQAQSIVEDGTVLMYQSIISDEDGLKKISLKQLKRLPNFEAYLYQWLSPFGFSAWNDIYDLVNAETGKQVLSEKFKLLKDRDFLILAPQSKKIKSKSFFILENQKEVKKPIKLTFSEVADLSNATNTTIFVDAEKLKYPLELRKWNENDIFYPFGMNGKSKKVGKFLKDEKIESFKKEHIWVLCSDSQIVWVVGLRADERFKISDSTTSIVQIQLLQ